MYVLHVRTVCVRVMRLPCLVMPRLGVPLISVRMAWWWSHRAVRFGLRGDRRAVGLRVPHTVCVPVSTLLCIIWPCTLRAGTVAERSRLINCGGPLGPPHDPCFLGVVFLPLPPPHPHAYGTITP